MASVNPYWAALVPAWESIRAADDRTAAIQAVVRPIEDRDPSVLRLVHGMLRAGRDA